MGFRRCFFMFALAAGAYAGAAYAAEDASVSVGSPVVEEKEEGRHIVQDVTLATSAASYTLRYDIIERPDTPGRVGFQKWAPTKGYTPLGIAAPSMENWYNQGFFIWTFDGFNIQDYEAEFRIIREFGQDGVVEYVWDTPKVRAVARFAITAQSDKLLFFGSYEPKEEIREVTLRLMAYPATFEKPWVRTLTTSTRTLTEGTVEIDLAKERWLLLEDVHPGRKGAGPAGLLLGDGSAFERVAVAGIGGYAEYVDMMLAPDRRDFVLGFYENPALPDNEETRAYFRAMGDAESNALARLAGSGLDAPLTPLPVDEARMAKAVEADDALLNRPAETWQPNPEPLAFPWAAQLPGPPVRVALLAARWAAVDTMELARRLEMDVRHQYFDSKSTIANPRNWPYRGQTGIGSLGTSLATRNAVRICLDDSRDVIFVGDLDAGAIGPRLRSSILNQVTKGKGLVLTGGADVLAGWPKELTAKALPEVAQGVLGAVPWGQMPGLCPGGRGRIGDDAPLKVYAYGQGRVLIFKANLGRYLSLLPLNHATQGLDAVDDRLLALHAHVMLAAAGRPLPAAVDFAAFDEAPPAGKPFDLPVTISGTWEKAQVRVQDDHGLVVEAGDDPLDADASCIRLPALPGGRRYYVDVRLLNGVGECLGFGSTALDVAPAYVLGDVAFEPGRLNHTPAPPTVDLPAGGPLLCETLVSPAPKSQKLEVEWAISDCLDRLLAQGRSEVGPDGVCTFDARLGRPVTVPHRVDLTLFDGDTPLARKRAPFTIPVPFPYDDFSILMWSYAGGDMPVRWENRLCYEMGSDMMDLCHMTGYSDEGAAREYAVAARSGERLVPYVTRIAMESAEDHSLKPGLFNEKWIEGQRANMEVSCRQAAPYAPAAYTLGDENYLSRGKHEVEVSPESMAAFRKWLEARYGTIDALNETWRTDYAGFEAITEPMLIEEAAQQTESFAPWFDFRAFMDTAFVQLHERLAGFVRKEDPGAKVGWDGLLRYHWLAGYDFYQLTRNLELNQVYTSHKLQTELIRSFKRPDALVGEWGNAIADNEEGFSAIIWHNLFKGHNSCWWWTSWGCDYIPFNPDLSTSDVGRWFFEQAQEVKSGVGKLLLHAERDDTEVAVLYSQADLFAQELASRMGGDKPWPGELSWQNNLEGVMEMLDALDLRYQFVAATQIEVDASALDTYCLLVLPYASCLSDVQVERIRAFVERGGHVIADGRAGMLTENGVIRDERPLDDVLGVKGSAGVEAFGVNPAIVSTQLGEGGPEVAVLEPEIELTARTWHWKKHKVPHLLIWQRFGQGGALLLNFPFASFKWRAHDEKEEQEKQEFYDFVNRALDRLALGGNSTQDDRPYSGVWGASEAARSALFRDGNLHYLCVEQDIFRRDLPQQELILSTSDRTYVYDVRARKRVRVQEISYGSYGMGDAWVVDHAWRAPVSRGRPLVFAVLPYRVTEVEMDAPEEVRGGEAIPIEARIRARLEADEWQPEYHVVHVDVFAPGADEPHREYSQNIECPGGEGRGSIPLALNDAPGAWRLVARDVATGVSTEKTVEVAAGP